MGPQDDPEGDQETEGAPLKKGSTGELLTPPKSWIVGNGGTPGCLACKQIQETGKSHSRVHSKGCRRRYTKWASENRSQEDLDPGLGGSSLPILGVLGCLALGQRFLGTPERLLLEVKDPPNQAELEAFRC